MIFLKICEKSESIPENVFVQVFSFSLVSTKACNLFGIWSVLSKTVLVATLSKVVANIFRDGIQILLLI